MADNPLLGSILDPAGIQLQMARQQALYDALAQQSLTPQQGQMVSGHYIAPAFGGLSNIGKALIAKNTFNNMLGERAQLSNQMAQNLANIFGNGRTQTVQPTNPNPVPVPSTQDVMNSPNMTSAITDQAIANNTNQQNTPAPVQIQQPGIGFDNLMKIGMASSMLGPEAGTAMANWSKPTDASLMANQAGVDPLAANKAALFKATQPSAYRAGSIVPSANGTMTQMPGEIAGAQAFLQPNGQWGYSQSPGALPALANSASATSGGQAAGKAPYTFQTITPANTNNPLLVSDAQIHSAVGQPGGLSLQSPAQLEIQKNIVEAQKGAAGVQAALQPLLSTIEQARQIAPTVPYGAYGKAEAQEKLSSLFGTGQAANAGAQWDALTGNLKLAVIKTISSGGLGRMDIPIVNAIKEFADVPDWLPPQAKIDKLNQLEALLKNQASAASNVPSQISNPPSGNQPMVAAPVTKVLNGKTYTLINGQWNE